MKYSFTCLIPGCGHTNSVEAANDDQAVDALFAKGSVHRSESHPEIKADERLIREVIRGQMARG